MALSCGGKIRRSVRVVLCEGTPSEMDLLLECGHWMHVRDVADVNPRDMLRRGWECEDEACRRSQRTSFQLGPDVRRAAEMFAGDNRVEIPGFVPEPYVTDTRKPLIGTRRRGT